MPFYLACYDYGQGGIWLYVNAESPDHIRRAYPSLTVFETAPAFWTEELEVSARKANPETDPFWKDWLEQLRAPNQH